MDLLSLIQRLDSSILTMRRKKRFSTVTHFCKIGVSQATITGFCITWRPGEQLEGRRAMVGQLPNSLPGRGNSLSRLFVTRKKSRELASKFHVERSCVSKQSDQRVWSVHYKQICPWIQPRYRNNAKRDVICCSQSSVHLHPMWSSDGWWAMLHYIKGCKDPANPLLSSSSVI